MGSRGGVVRFRPQVAQVCPCAALSGSLVKRTRYEIFILMTRVRLPQESFWSFQDCKIHRKFTVRGFCLVFAYRRAHDGQMYEEGGPGSMFGRHTQRGSIPLAAIFGYFCGEPSRPAVFRGSSFSQFSVSIPVRTNRRSVRIFTRLRRKICGAFSILRLETLAK